MSGGCEGHLEVQRLDVLRGEHGQVRQAAPDLPQHADHLPELPLVQPCTSLGIQPRAARFCP